MKKSMKKMISILLAIVMIASMFSVLPLSASAAGEGDLPSSFDLRDRDVVTSAKQQDPWSTCWAFGSTAAAEISILSMLKDKGKGIDASDLDLSEKHLAWFGANPITEAVDPMQAGEGMYVTNKEDVPNITYNNGAYGVNVSTLFASGIGPVYEKYFPYQGDEAITEVQFLKKYPEKGRATAIQAFVDQTGMTPEELIQDPDAADAQGYLRYLRREGYLTEPDNTKLTAEMVEEATLKQYIDGSATTNCYAKQADWSIPEYSTIEGEECLSRNVSSGFTMVDGNRLPDLFNVDENKKWESVNWDGVNAVKAELYAGHGVTAGLKADTSAPGEVSENPMMNEETWAHYTNEDLNTNHMICIVGWDDDYSASNFLEGKQPPGNGAWLCKNSWGSEVDYTELEGGGTIGYYEWGIEENGKHTGYFWVSYYDKTLSCCESMTFDTDLSEADGELVVRMYDYMPSLIGVRTSQITNIQDSGLLKTANVFVNDSGADVNLASVSTKTAYPNANVKYSVYLLNDNAANPEDGTLLGTKTAAYEYAGFHRENLDGSITIKKGGKFAVVAEETVVKNGATMYEYAVNASYSKSYAEAVKTAEAESGISSDDRDRNADEYGVAVVNKGESFVFEDGTWTDWSEYEPRVQNLNDYAIDNFSIKAYMIAKTPEPEIILGDVDGDGVVDVTDATLIQRYDVKMAKLDDWQLKAADVDGDGEVTILDVTWIQRYIAEMKAPEGIGKPIKDYTEKKLPVYRETMDSDETVNVRMYGDVPYMKIDEYYNQLYFTGADAYPEEASEMTVTRSGSRYVTTAYNGVKGTFDAEADTLNIENLETYTATPYYTILLDKEGDPSAPFVRNTSTDYTGEVKPVAVDLSQYGINVIGDGDELWVPLGLLQYTFCSPYSYVAFYNGKGIYIEDGMSILQKQNAKSLDPNYYDFTKEERSQQKIDYDYGCLCYYVDTFYGYPERCRLADSIRAVGLDKTLDKTIDGMKLPLVKQYLTSKDMGDYALGLLCLFMFGCDDGGHTAFNDVIWAAPDVTATWREKRMAAGIDYTEKTNQSEASMAALSATLTGLDPADYDRFERLVYSNDDGAYYMEKGDTAMFVVAGGYFCDRAGWTAYYNDKTINELPADTLGSLSKALEKAKSNASIKKFVVNIAMCNGGESGFSTYISKLMSGQTYRHQFNEFSGQDEMLHYNVDMNFDRVFDEKDDEVTYPFTFAVVAGAQSYSAANYLANMAKDNGIALLGETTGGGACAPQHTTESEGLTFNLSSRYKLMDKNNKHVDFGVDPDFVLTKDNNGTPDYSDYFNLDVIGNMVDE
ncbi:dockerin type I domain-containing protein [Ruminococcus difficilis]|uniref:Dockerin domain-containing protein n=1 Tax=Ruminococcus difficilis TaxID=2763069 RepID=A0A934U1H8_9FIRM|nr:dockerin type I domain-containing protein [Ruminococcus difficilis]MBK6087554.1 hypothetical protein [Ruminococcus difficilis]